MKEKNESLNPIAIELCSRMLSYLSFDSEYSNLKPSEAEKALEIFFPAAIIIAAKGDRFTRTRSK